jgi:2OG-Fe(II) oxygenase superfamily
MNLFPYEPTRNLLPFDGIVNYYGPKRKGDSPLISIQLENGSLLIMKGTTQTFWQHSVPKTAKIASPRINLTFRTIFLEAAGRFDPLAARCRRSRIT